MIGFYDYTVILTYLSILSGTTGIILCLNGIGHPYLGMFFLLLTEKLPEQRKIVQRR